MGKHKRYTRLDDDDIVLILKMRSENKTYREIAEAFGVDPATVKRYCAAEKMQWSQSDIAYIEKRAAEGWKVEMVAEHFSCDPRRISAIMRIHGISNEKSAPHDSLAGARRRADIVMKSKKYSY